MNGIAVNDQEMNKEGSPLISPVGPDWVTHPSTQGVCLWDLRGRDQQTVPVREC